MLTPPPQAPLALVLDTNVVIDWLVFDHPFMEPLRRAAAVGRVRILTYDPAIDEVRRVLAYPMLKLPVTRQSAVMTQYLAQTVLATVPPDFTLDALQTPPGFPRCRDPDDQHFLALAFHTRAHALASRDKAVLKLTRRLRKFGVTLFTVPELIETCVRLNEPTAAASVTDFQ